ncbi:MAG: hypothetical protein Q8O14_08750 [bacterium]|jgi:hypothetical protein|nr:hypothetical protein [bacterium]
MASTGMTWLAALGLMAGMAQAAPSFDDLFKDFESTTKSQVEDFVQPLGDALTALASGGTFHGARSKGLLGLDVGLKLVSVPFSSGDVPAGSVLDRSEASAVGLPMLTASKGLVKGLQVGARFMSLELDKEVGSLQHLGASLRFEINELFHIPLLMPRLGLQADWSRLQVGDALTTTATGLDLIVSKSFVVLEPYAGISLIQGRTELDYTSRAPGLEGQKVGLDLDSNPVRLAAGVNITPFPLLRINAEYALGDFNTITVGALLNLF